MNIQIPGRPYKLDLTEQLNLVFTYGTLMHWCRQPRDLRDLAQPKEGPNFSQHNKGLYLGRVKTVDKAGIYLFGEQALPALVTDLPDADRGKAKCVFGELYALDKQGFLELIEFEETGRPESAYIQNKMNVKVHELGQGEGFSALPESQQAQVLDKLAGYKINPCAVRELPSTGLVINQVACFVVPYNRIQDRIVSELMAYYGAQAAERYVRADEVGQQKLPSLDEWAGPEVGKPASQSIRQEQSPGNP